MLTQHNRKSARLSPDYTLAIRELGVWSGDETRPAPPKKTEGSGDPYIHVWWPWNAIIQQFVYIPELLNFARMQYGIIMQISMQMASNCYCCEDDLSSGEKKKRRRPLSSADMQRTLQTLESDYTHI